MKDATRTYNIVGAQTLDLGELSAIKIKKLVISSAAASGTATIPVRGTGIFDNLAVGAAGANYINVPVDESGNATVAGFYERKPGYTANLLFSLIQHTTEVIDLGGAELHRIEGIANVNIKAIAY